MTHPIPAPDAASDLPPGFVRVDDPTEAAAFNGPHYLRQAASGPGMPGVRVMERHLNRAGTCHGGVLAVFADMMGRALDLTSAEKTSPSITLSVDCLAPVRLGDWVETTPELNRATRRMFFFQALTVVGDEPVARVNGIYRRLSGTVSDPVPRQFNPRNPAQRKARARPKGGGNAGPALPQETDLPTSPTPIQFASASCRRHASGVTGRFGREPDRFSLRGRCG